MHLIGDVCESLLTPDMTRHDTLFLSMYFSLSISLSLCLSLRQIVLFCKVCDPNMSPSQSIFTSLVELLSTRISFFFLVVFITHALLTLPGRCVSCSINDRIGTLFTSLLIKRCLFFCVSLLVRFGVPMTAVLTTEQDYNDPTRPRRGSETQLSRADYDSVSVDRTI